MGRVDDSESRYEAVASRDLRFEGRFVVAVTSTGVYCRVGCPSRTPRRDRVRFFASPAAASAAGFRPCKRCRPDRAGDAEAPLVQRALELIAAGVVDTEGVDGLARRLAVDVRTLHRRLAGSVGATPLQLARSRRVQTARTLIARTAMPLVDVAFAAGFGSLRQFNDVMRADLGGAPSGHRGEAARAGEPDPDPGGWLSLRLPVREPFAAGPLFAFLAARAVPGVESLGDGDDPLAAGAVPSYARALRTPHGAAVVVIGPGPGHVALRVRLDDLADLENVVRRCRRLLDLDSDPASVAAILGRDPLLRRLLAGSPGVRVPGSAEPFETAVRAVLGQQVSVAAARTLARRLVARHGEALASPHDGVSHLFPTPERLAEADLDGLGLTGRRVASVRALSRAVAAGDLDLVAGDAAGIDLAMSRLPGFGPWTRAYIAMRARGDPDAIPVGDLGLRHAMERLGEPADPRSIARRSEAWRPWRAYAALLLWQSLSVAPASGETIPPSAIRPPLTTEPPP
ncbi:MAG: AlkA N-terminal domain-containing protein [Candidatus Dormibacteria bacterium]|jgi:AraC family transcriptional regulator of adaptative response / DNA-3-methyladenine glycosylase II